MAEVPEGSLESWVCNAPDALIRDVVAVLEYEPGTDLRRRERGRWGVSLAQRLADGRSVEVTAVKPVRSPRAAPFKLGRQIRPLTYGHPVYLRIVYSATDGAEALFWTGCVAVNVTIHVN